MKEAKDIIRQLDGDLVELRSEPRNFSNAQIASPAPVYSYITTERDADKLHIEISRLEAMKNFNQMEIKHLKIDVQTLKGNIADLTTAKNELEEAVKQYKMNELQKSSKLDEVEQQNAALLAQLERFRQFESEANTWENKLLEMKQASSVQYSAEREELQKRLQDLTAELEAITTEKNRFGEVIASLNAEKRSDEDRIRSLVGEAERKDESSKRIIADLRQELDLKVKERDDIAALVANANLETSRLKQMVEDLQNELRDRELRLSNYANLCQSLGQTLVENNLATSEELDAKISTLRSPSLQPESAGWSQRSDEAAEAERLRELEALRLRAGDLQKHADEQNIVTVQKEQRIRDLQDELNDIKLKYDEQIAHSGKFKQEVAELSNILLVLKADREKSKNLLQNYQDQLAQKTDEKNALQKHLEEESLQNQIAQQTSRRKVEDLEAELAAINQRFDSLKKYHADELELLNQEIAKKAEDNAALLEVNRQNEKLYAERIEALSLEISIMREPPQAPAPPPATAQKEEPTADVEPQSPTQESSGHAPQQINASDSQNNLAKLLQDRRSVLVPANMRALAPKPDASASLTDLIYSSLQRRFQALQSNIREEEDDVEELEKLEDEDL
eukprot:TRINITY_DN3319_c0_g1_i1.p1 TRINITY_DN3319_c0_g1~~TRINITY_DN3319_c0_g1_i1.p1  ORF type:complete len:623 (+),score=215.90 TRINITY_DN3319_c0_g1_i1:315-2183(+)